MALSGLARCCNLGRRLAHRPDQRRRSAGGGGARAADLGHLRGRAVVLEALRGVVTEVELVVLKPGERVQAVVLLEGVRELTAELATLAFLDRAVVVTPQGI